MKRTLLVVASLFVYGLLTAQDSLVRGGFVEYTYLGNHVYEAKLSLYVSCPYPDMTPYIGCKVGGDTLTGDTLIFVQETDITGIPAICPVQSKCTGDTNAVYGIMRLTWTRKFDLDTASQCDVLFFAYAGKRDAGITTGSAGQNFYIDSWLNQCAAPESSSPTMAAQNENGYMIYNRDQVLNYGASTYGDFDSVSYAMAAGRTAPGNQIYYAVPYSYTRPICFFGFPNQNLNWPVGFHLDPLTGQIMFRPTSLCFGPLAVEISLWKDGSSGMSVASKLYRELAVQVLASNGNFVPKILPPYSTQACAGQQSCFYIQTDDDDASDSVFLSIESDIPGLSHTIDHSQSRHATAQVCWTPDSSFIGNFPYTFLAKVRDNHCDLPGTQTRAFSIFVRETPKAQTSILTQNCGRVILSATPLKNYIGMQMQWKIVDSLGMQVALTSKAIDTLIIKPGKYKTAFSIWTSTPCFETYYDSFEIAAYNQVKLISDYLFCYGDSINAQAVNSENHLFEFEWKRVPHSLPDTFLTTQISYFADSSHSLILTVKWGDYCQVSDSQLIRVWHPRKELPGSVSPFCKGDSTILSVLDPVDSFGYVWSTGETTDSIMVSIHGWYKLSTTYFSGCQHSDSIEIIPDFPAIYFNAPDSICPGDTIKVSASVIGNYPIERLWQDSSKASSTLSTGGWMVLQVTDKNGCRNEDSVYISLHEVTPPDTNYFALCRGDGFHLFSEDNSGLDIYYSFGDTGNYVIPDSSGMAEALVITEKGCESVFQIEIVVNELPDPGFTYSTLTERSLLFIPTNQWNTYYSWDFGDNSNSSQMIVNHTFNSNGPHGVSLAVTDRSSGCADSSTQQLLFHVGLNALADANIQVFPNPFGKSFQIISPESGLYRIYTPLGSLIQEGHLDSDRSVTIYSEDWKSGIYLIYVESEASIHSGKIMRR